MSGQHGTAEDGVPITEVMVEAMADEAEVGYDVEEIQRRNRGGRRRMGSAAASVESVRLDPEMKRALPLRAATDGVSVSETSAGPWTGTYMPADRGIGSSIEHAGDEVTVAAARSDGYFAPMPVPQILVGDRSAAAFGTVSPSASLGY